MFHRAVSQRGITRAARDLHSISPKPPQEITKTILFRGTKIETTLTSKGEEIRKWIEKYRPNNTTGAVLGLDLEWKPMFNHNKHNKTALMQICDGHRCLIVQTLYVDYFPKCLSHFLSSTSGSTFVGVGIEADVRRLTKDFGLHCNGVTELGHLAAEKYVDPKLASAGLCRLCKHVLGYQFSKSEAVQLSDWSQRCLSKNQVEYACIDAFVSFSIGKALFDDVDVNVFNLALFGSILGLEK